MSETLGLSEKGDKELEQLSSSVLIPMQMVLDLTKRVMLTGAILRSPAFNEGMRKGLVEEREAHRDELGKTLLPELFKDLKDDQNIKSVILYPLLISTLNTWRKFDFEFAEKILEQVKANEPDEKLRLLIEQIDLPVTSEQLRKN
jgi:hypothetical protein